MALFDIFKKKSDDSAQAPVVVAPVAGEGLMTRMNNNVLETLGFKPWGETNFAAARADMMRFMIISVGYFCMELYAFSLLWDLFRPQNSYVLNVLLAAVFALVSLKVDISWATSDLEDPVTETKRRNWSTWIWVGGRVAIMLAFLVCTAIPFSIGVSKTILDRRMDAREQTAIDAIRAKAHAKEDAAYTKLLADAKHDLDAAEAKVAAIADVDQYRKDRADARQKLVDSNQARRATLTKMLTDKSDQVALEAAGKGPSGRYGNGPAMKQMKKQEKEARLALDKFETEVKGEITTFDETTRSKLADLQKTRDANVISTTDPLKRQIRDLESERDKTFDKVAVMDPEDLRGRYGGQYKLSRGFFDYYTELEQVKSEDSRVWWIDMIIKMMMAAVVVALIMLKLRPNPALRTYYSVWSQAEAGNPLAIKIVEACGFTDRDTRRVNSYRPALRAKLDEIKLEQTNVAHGFGLWQRKLVELATKKDEHGLHLDRGIIEGKLRESWDWMVVTAVKILSEVEVAMTNMGVNPPKWPKGLYEGNDPRKLTSPWAVSHTYLERHGWVDPAPKIARAEQAAEELQNKRFALVQALLSLQNELISTISKTAGANWMSLKRVVETAMKANYSSNILPILSDISRLEATIEATGLPVPAWPVHLDNPMDGIRDCWKLPDEAVLRAEYGWTGPLSPKELAAKKAAEEAAKAEAEAKAAEEAAKAQAEAEAAKAAEVKAATPEAPPADVPAPDAVVEAAPPAADPPADAAPAAAVVATPPEPAAPKTLDAFFGGNHAGISEAIGGADEHEFDVEPAGA